MSFDIEKEVHRLAINIKCWCATSPRRCAYHDGMEDGMYRLVDMIGDGDIDVDEFLEE